MTKFRKTTACMLAMSMMVGTVSGAFADATPQATIQQAQQTVSFGDAQREYAPGSYIVSISILNETLTGLSSCDSSFVSQAVLTVAEDGSATIEADLIEQAKGTMAYFIEGISYLKQNGDWQAVTELAWHEASYVEGNDAPASKIVIELEDNLANGVMLNGIMATNSFYQGNHNFFLQVNEFVSTGADFGTSETHLNQGVYEVPVSLMQASNQNEFSTAYKALEDTAILEVSTDGQATLEVSLGAVTVGELEGYVNKFQYYISEDVNAEFLSNVEITSTHSNGTISSAVMQITSNNLDGIFVCFGSELMPVQQDAYIKIDYVNAKEIKEIVPETPETPETPEVPETPEENDGFGLANVVLEAGEYNVPVSLRNASKQDELSMAYAILGDTAVLEVLEDNSAKIEITLGKMTFAGIEDLATKVQYYTSNEIDSDYLVDAIINEVDEDGNPTSATLVITNNSLDGMFINFASNFHPNGTDAYIKFDYESATLVTPEAPEVPEVPEITVSFGSENTVLEVGEYEVPVSLLNAYNHANESMASSALAEKAVLLVSEDGKATLEVSLGTVVVATIEGHVNTLQYYTSDEINVEFLVEALINETHENGAIANATMEITNNELDGLYVAFGSEAMPVSPQDAYIKIDYVNAVKIVDEEEQGDNEDGNTSTGGSSSGSSSGSSNSGTTQDTEDETEDDAQENSQADVTVESFSDISSNQWHYEAVKFAIENGLMTGVAEGTFAPEKTTTRAMIWTMLYRHVGGEGETTGANWYQAPQEWAMENEISDGTNPNSEMTREQFATILYRLAGEPEVEENDATEGFSDAENISSWASDAMNWAVNTGLLQGSDGNLNPVASATRAEVATMLMRYIQD